MQHQELQNVLATINKIIEGTLSSEVELIPITRTEYWQIIRNDPALHLNWQHYMPRFQEKKDSFHFVAKPKGETELLSGVVGYFDSETNQLKIGLLEHFIKSADNPMKGSLIKVMAMAAAYFLVVVKGNECVILEPLPDVVGLYANVGFTASKICPDSKEVLEMTATPFEIIQKVGPL